MVKREFKTYLALAQNKIKNKNRTVKINWLL